MIISDKIVYLRKRLGCTQEELAEQLNVSRQSISKWESAQSIPDITKIMAMAELFSVSTDYLLRDDIEHLEGEPTVDCQSTKTQVVSMETANEFIRTYEIHLRQFARGVFLFIFAAVPLIALQAFVGSALSESVAHIIGLSFILLAVTGAVGLCIYANSLIEDYKFITLGDFELSYNVEGIIKEFKKSYKPVRLKNLVTSIAILILSALPLLVSGIVSSSEWVHILMVSFLITAVAFGVGRLVYGEGKYECYELLLQEGDFKKPKAKKETIEGLYWSIVLIVYLAWSFLTSDWHITWIVWPVSALLSAVLPLLWGNDKK